MISTTAGFRAAYDANGNMVLRVEVSGTQRITYTQEWDAENRLAVVTNTVTGQVTRFVYDGDGNRVLRIGGSGTTVYIGDYYEQTGSAVRKYYYAGGQRIAVRVNGALYHLHSDHLGSAVVATWGQWPLRWRLYLPVVLRGEGGGKAGGSGTGAAVPAKGAPEPFLSPLVPTFVSPLPPPEAETEGKPESEAGANGGMAPLTFVSPLPEPGEVVEGSETRYRPYGAVRAGDPVGAMPTDRRFTGQRWDGALGLYDYRARFYDPALGRFLQPDPLVPEPGNPQALNRYAYVYNNPLRYVDKSGHIPLDWLLDLAGLAVDIYSLYKEPSWENVGWLALDLALWALPYVPAAAGVAARGGKLARAAAHADDILDVAKEIKWAERFAGASPEVLQGIERLEKLVKSEQIWEPYRRGLAAELLRAEELYKAGKLKAVEAVVEGGRVDLILVTEEIVELKYWRQSYAERNIREILKQVQTYQATGCPVILEFVQTKTEPISEAFIEKLLRAAQDANVPLTREQIRLITLGGP